MDDLPNQPKRGTTQCSHAMNYTFQRINNWNLTYPGVLHKLLLLFLCFSVCPKWATAQKQGQERLDSLLVDLRHAKVDTNQVNLLKEIALLYFYINPKQGINYGEQAVALSRRLGWRKGLVGSLNSLAANYANEPSKSLPLFEEALKIAKEINYEKGIRTILMNSTQAYRIMGKPQKAIEMAMESKRLSELAGDTFQIFQNDKILGGLYSEIGEYPNALSASIDALRLVEKTDDLENVAEILSNIGVIYFLLGDYDQSIHYSSEAQKKYDKIGTTALSLTNKLNLGEAYRLKGNWPVSLAYYEQTLKAYTQLNDTGNMSSCNWGISELYLVQKKYERAREYAYTALAQSRSGQFIPDIAHALNCIGKSYLFPMLDTAVSAEKKQLNQLDRRNHLTLAVQYLEEAVAEARKQPVVDVMQDAFQQLAIAYNFKGEYQKSVQNYEQYVRIKDSIFSRGNANKLIAQQMQYDFDKKEALINAENEKALQRQKFMRNGFIGGTILFLLLAGAIFMGLTKTRIAKRKSDELLRNILPNEVAEELKETGSAAAKYFDNVTVLFTDFVDFTKLSGTLSPEELVYELHTCFKAFDEIIGKYGIEKIKTIGDAYLAVCGLPLADNHHAEKIVRAAMEIAAFMQARHQQAGHKTFGIRIGIHSGNVVAGIVGVKKFAYDIWGDTVNTAARMEQNSEPGRINISETTYALVKSQFRCTPRGKIDAKGKGAVDMYFVEELLK